MAKVPIPNKTVAGPMSTDTPLYQTGPNSYKAKASLDAASTIENVLSKTVPDILVAAQVSKDRNDITDTQLEYNKRMTDIISEVQQNSDIGSWVSEAAKKYTSLKQELLTKNISQKAKKSLSRYFKDAWTKQGVELSLRSKTLIAENERAKLPRVMSSFVTANDRKSFEKVLDSMEKSNPSNLLPEERANWLKEFDTAAVANKVRLSLEAGNYEGARSIAQAQEDSEMREKLNAHIDTFEASAKREEEKKLIANREKAYAGLLTDYWDGTLTNPQVVTAALKDGLIDSSDAISLRNAMTAKNTVENSSLEAIANIEEALLRVREGLATRSDVLKVIARNADKLKPTDGKSYIQQAFAEQDKTDAYWDREAWDYIEKQILSVSSVTGMLYGNAEQQSIAAQAHISYSEAKRKAVAEGKPLSGEELLVLAHKIMIPFRGKIKPIIGSDKVKENIPEKLDFNKTSIDYVAEPNSVEEFERIYKTLGSVEQRRMYYDKYADKVYGE